MVLVVFLLYQFILTLRKKTGPHFTVGLSFSYAFSISINKSPGAIEVPAET